MPWPMFWPGHKKIKAGDRVAGGRIEDIGLKWWQREIVHSGSSITLPVRWPLDQYQLPILILIMLAESCGISDSCWGPYYWILSGMKVLLISVKAWLNFNHVRLSVEGAQSHCALHRVLFLQWQEMWACLASCYYWATGECGDGEAHIAAGQRLLPLSLCAHWACCCCCCLSPLKRRISCEPLH